MREGSETYFRQFYFVNLRNLIVQRGRVITHTNPPRPAKVKVYITSHMHDMNIISQRPLNLLFNRKISFKNNLLDKYRIFFFYYISLINRFPYNKNLLIFMELFRLLLTLPNVPKVLCLYKTVFYPFQKMYLLIHDM